ncbi:ABC transporter permease [Fimbriiglobus ruber]|uniref:Transport permease protein n=1 Tax=Fimbriiglobus ruber TaxID=1908690 RepID=A0A225E5K1_9BACT|nr:ABC transporter permease [Fimbriiglobus ruber]OWK43955.1 O-antigen export system, permease protein [Fimbriiglobus ruber]
MRYYGPSPRWRAIDFREVWLARELFWTLVVRDIKVRFRQTLVGLAWVVLQPVATTAIFLALFGLLGRQPTGGEVPYALVVLSGLLPWQLFASVLTNATHSLVLNQNLIGKVFFPRIILPLTAVGPALVDFAVGCCLLAGLMLYFGVSPTRSVVLLPVAVLLPLFAAIGVGVWLSALNAIYRDVGYAVPFLLQIGFFVSPVVYATSALIPEEWRAVFSLNPMVGAIEAFRWAVFGRGEAPFRSALVAVVVIAAALASGMVYFRRVEGYLADRI